MTRITDGKDTVAIKMTMWNGERHTPDFSGDFFEVGSLAYDEEKEAYIVPDVNYCINRAEDWKNFEGDFHDDIEGYDLVRDGERYVFVDA